MALREKLLPINPFSRRQRQIIRLAMKGYSREEIGEKLGISPHTVKNHIYGSKPIEKGSKSTIGIFGIIEKATGKRPEHNSWPIALLGDVILFKERRRKGE